MSLTKEFNVQYWLRGWWRGCLIGLIFYLINTSVYRTNRGRIGKHFFKAIHAGMTINFENLHENSTSCNTQRCCKPDGLRLVFVFTIRYTSMRYSRRQMSGMNFYYIKHSRSTTNKWNLNLFQSLFCLAFCYNPQVYDDLYRRRI